jgi:2-hydroxy-3-keto-5-methylthiopentenyl-1-phosphate phosphatase
VKKKNLYIFTDFDGTITIKDIGDELFKEFGLFEPYNTQLRNGILKIEDYWKILCSGLKKGINEKIITEYAGNFEIDPYFKKFTDYCRDNSIPLAVVSDGFDSYINPVMKKIGAEWIPVHCNKMIFENGNITPYYPMANESCNCPCASCKRNIILSEVPEDAIITFIGDGYSDYCAAEHTDIIFAKKELAAYCNEKKLPHYPFSSFFDIYKIITEIIPKKKLKQRNQAKQLRKKAYEIE